MEELIMKRIVVTLLIILFSAGVSTAQTDSATGEVKLPLNQYTALINKVEDQKRPAPSGYALGQARVNVTVSEKDSNMLADVNVDLTIRVLEDEWVLVPVLPHGTAIHNAAVSGNAVELISSSNGLSWGVNRRGSYNMRLNYKLDARSSKKGYVLPLPLPEAASITLNATIPGTGLDVAIIPGEGTTTSERGENTYVQATIPTSSSTQISWAYSTC